jgi:hypothetical protein
MAIDSADKPQWLKDMEKKTSDYERKMKKRLGDAEKKTQRPLADALEKDRSFHAAKQEQDRQFVAQKSAEYSPEAMSNRETQMKREYQKAKQQEYLNIPDSGQTEADEEEEEEGGEESAGPEEGPQESGGETALEEQQGGIKGALARQKQKDSMALEQANKAKAALAAGEVGEEGAAEVINKSYKLLWSYLHEFFEDTALSFTDVMLVTGPLCVAFFFFRILAMLSIGWMFKINFKDVEVPLVPTFSMAEVPLRVGKTLLIAAISGAIWGIIVFVAWVYTNQAEAILKFGKEVVDIIIGS